MPKNLVLIGFMGTGKSSVGKVLGRKLSRPVIDVDQTIESRANRKIDAIFETDGEAAFRRMEREAVAEAAAHDGAVITTGGGAVLDPENMKALRANGWILSLSASPETIFLRVKGSRHRPLLRSGDVLGEIARLLEARKGLYDDADYRFETDGRSPSQVARMILDTLKDKL